MYTVRLRPAAARALTSVHPTDRKRIRGAIILLGQDPRPPSSRRLKGRDGFRVRVGNYRILYQIREEELIVIVVTSGHRREVYR